MSYPHPMDDTTGFEATDEEMGLCRSLREENRILRSAINGHLAVIDKYPNATRSLDALEQSIADLRVAVTDKF
jgi:hypothetical protein